MAPTATVPTAVPETFVPADTRTMRIVHNALRRDLIRARDVLSTLPFPHDRQRVALADHLRMVMEFLHKHHHAEETGLYPLIRRDPSAAALLDEMAADHDRLDPGVDAVTAAAAAYRVSPDARIALIAALDQLNEPLWPHLQREEDELMPIASRTVSKSEWETWERGLVASRSLPELAREGLWIVDGIPADEQAVMWELAPAPVMWIIRNVFGRGYRKRAFARWWSPEYSPWTLPVSGSCSVVSAASPDEVWAVLSDVTRTGEWSHECHTVRWLPGSSGGVGAQFRGANKQGRVRWSRPCTVTEWEPGRLLQFRTRGPRIGQDCSEWTFVLEPVDGGTRITQTFRILRLPVIVDRLLARVVPAHLDRADALRGDLERLAALAVPAPGAALRP